MIVYKKTDEWYIEWQRVVQQVTTNDNEWFNKWQGVTTIATKEWQRMRMSGNEWKQMTMSESDWQQVKQSDFEFQDETKGQSGSRIILFIFLCNM